MIHLQSTPDNTLMLKVKNGDLDKLGLLFERYHRRLFGFFYRLTLRRDLSEDLVQGVFERILKYRSTYTEEGEFSTWIFRIARNHYADYYRESSKMPVENHDGNWESFSAEQQDLPLQAEEVPYRNLLRKAMKKLEPEKKQVLVLSRYEGFSYREIAGIMDCTEGAVKVRVYRALNELKDIVSMLNKEE